MSFAERIEQAVTFEQKLINGLNAKPEWTAWPFGQALLPEEARAALRQCVDDYCRPHLIRWFPDVLAFHQKRGIHLFDAKTTNNNNKESGNYAIEMASVEVAEVFIRDLFVPTFFICADGKVLTPRIIRERGWLGPQNGGGSGTPYFLVEKRWAPHWRDILEYAA